MKILVANWKENPENIEQSKELINVSNNFLKNNSNFEIIHSIPSIFSAELNKYNDNLYLQDISKFINGTHTGEISPLQAKSLKIKGSIVGHSERRIKRENISGDNDFDINQKIINLFNNGLGAILCIGEEKRDENWKEFIKTQLNENLKKVKAFDLKKLMIAYEPVWAIGENAKRVATKEEIIETINFIKEELNNIFSDSFKEIKILYGGSVNENNINEIINISCVDGLLIGRASSDILKWQKLLANISIVKNYQNINDLNLKEGDKVILRADFNVPINNLGKIDNTFRIDKVIPTLIKLQNLKVKLLLISHIEEGDLDEVANYLDGKIKNFHYLNEVMGENVKNTFDNLKNGEILLLNNLRLQKEEKENSEILALFFKDLVGFNGFYINEAFSVSHRKHCSVYALPKLFKKENIALGDEFINELNNLNKVLEPEKPMLFILGGAKFETKLKILEKYINISDKVFVGGALAHSFWKEKGYSLGKSLLDNEVILNKTLINNEKIMLPYDVVIEDRTVKIPNTINENEKIVDFGPITLNNLKRVISQCKTIVWNGPVGYYEGGFTDASYELLKFLGIQNDKIVILGGGDTVSVLEKLNNKDLHFTHISSGGGAMLDYLANGDLVALEPYK